MKKDLYIPRPRPADHRLFSVFPTEYGFLFSFGKSRAEPHLPAQPIKTIHMIKYKIHAINAPTDHHTDIFSQKCKTNKITAGSSPSIFINIFMKRQGKKLPLRFELRIFSFFYLTSSREPPMYRSLRHRHR